MNYSITSEPLTGAQYLELRRSSGLAAPPISPATAEAALANSVLFLVARVNPKDASSPDSHTEAVGMIRLIGDGHVFCHVTDMCVHPSFRGQQVASALLDKLVTWIDANAPSAYVSMIGLPDAQAMYGRRGFMKTAGAGMARSKWGKMAD